MVHLLNAYFTAVTQAIRDHRGIIDKYIGDGVMAFWTPPFSPGDQHATDACLAALLQQEAIDAFRRELPQLLGLRRNVPDFKVRMGLATGEVVIGTIGSETARSYTVIGDIVNTASRLEGINKLYGTGIAVAEDTYRLAQQAVEVRELDFVTVVGKTEPVRIFELLGRAGEVEQPLERVAVVVRHRGLVAQQLDQLAGQGAQQVRLEAGERGDDPPAAPVPVEGTHSWRSIVAQRPYSCIACTSRSISSRLPVLTAERPSSWTSSISFSAFFLE